MIVLQPDEMRKVDRAAINAGFPELILMETAGRGVAVQAKKLLDRYDYQSRSKARILIFAGRGNNGGDGLVAARLLHMWGFQVQIVLMGTEKDLEGSTLTNYRLCRLRDIDIFEIKKGGIETKTREKIICFLNRADLVIDALLGTGLRGDVRGAAVDIIKLINVSDIPVLAVDIPSGIDGLNGKVLGIALRADVTVTMAYPKSGLVLYPGRDYVGRLELVDLGVPDSFAADFRHFMLTEREAVDFLPVRESTGHKGTFGKVGIIGGSPGMSGAPAMTGMAALKSGAGLVKIAVPEEIQISVALSGSELITSGLERGIEKESAGIKELIDYSNILAVGPGLGQGSQIEEAVAWILKICSLPVVLDADGINAIKDTDILKDRDIPIILTPHPGEMARLIKTDTKEVQQDRIKVAREFATNHRVYLVLKGAATIIALPDGRVFINPTGNQGMATAGSGDVLTGIISGLLAQGAEPEDAVVLGPYLHGLAGDLVSEEYCPRSITAGDLIQYLPGALSYLKKFEAKNKKGVS